MIRFRLRALLECAVFLLWLLPGQQAWRVSASDVVVPDPGFEEVWRNSQQCGLNSLYLFMHAHGHLIEYEELQQVLQVEANGNSLPQLRDAAARLGMRTAIFRGTPDDLPRYPSPVIILLESPRDQSGHFVVLIDYREDGAYIIDGSLAVRRRLTIDEFRRQWTGYLLMPAPAASWVPWLASLGGGLLLLSVYWLWRGRQPGQPKPVAASCPAAGGGS